MRQQSELPCNLESEKLVIGGVLLHPRSFCDVAPVVEAGDFYNPIHAAIFAAFTWLGDSRRPIDVRSVSERVRTANPGVMSAVGEAYFSELMSGVLTVENLGYHAQRIAAYARARRLIEAASSVAARGKNIVGFDVDSFLEDSETELSGAIGTAREVEYRSMAEVMRSVTKHVTDRYEAKHRIHVPWGFRDVDNLTMGSEPGHLCFVGGRAKIGKTAYAMASVEKVALSTDAIPQLVISLEMSGEELGHRQISSIGGIDTLSLRNPKRLSTQDWVSLAAATSKLAQAPIWCYAKPATIGQIKSIVRRWRMRETDKLRPARVVVDYLGRIKSQNRGRNVSREEEIASWTNALKDLAVEENIALCCLVQINRSVEQESEKRPQLWQLRGSGAIEADADMVQLVYREEFYHPGTEDDGILEVTVAANRHGPMGTVALGFDGQHMRLSDLPRSAVESWQARRQAGKPRQRRRDTVMPERRDLPVES